MIPHLILNNRLEAAKSYQHISNLTWKQLLLSNFSKGQRQSFFSIFDLLKKQQKLQFYLRVYFLIYSIHPAINANHKNLSIPQKEINSFREFLDTKGADLAKTSQFLQFYALPFIKKPLQHATFKTLFTKTWVSNLKQKLNSYIQIQQQSMKEAAKSFFSNNQKKGNGQKSSITPSVIERQLSSPSFNEPEAVISKNLLQQKYRKLQRTNSQLFSELQQIKQRYHQLQQNHQSMIEGFNDYMMQSQNKWFQSYKQLVKTAKGLLGVVGQMVGDNPKLERKYLQSKKKIQKYERFVARKLQDLLSVSQDISVFDKPSINQISQYTMKSGYTSKSWLTQLDKNISHSHNNNNITSYVQIDEYITTNFNKLNQQFLKLQDQTQEMIIQGFCWRLIKAKNRKVIRMYCLGMILGNFLGMGRIDNKSEQKQLQLCTRFLSNKKICHKVIQLLNYAKCDYYIRKYLFKQNNITYNIMTLMAQSIQQNDIQVFVIALDFVSTISIYKDYRNSILQSKLPLFLLNILESYPQLFEYEELMELIMMTLMNFSSCQQGLKMFEQYQNIFSLLSTVFQKESHDIMMLVNGFYYTLLSSKRLYELALDSNMVEFVKYLMSSQLYKQHHRQLKFVQQRLSKYCGENKTDKIENDKQSNLYLIDGEEEGQQIQIGQEELQNLQRYIKGHQLLSVKYSLKEKQADQQQRKIKLMNEEFIKNIIQIQQQIKTQNNVKSSHNSQPHQQIKNFVSNKYIPQQSKPKKPQMKSQEIQVSMINLTQNQHQSSIKQEIFNSPAPKIDSKLVNKDHIPTNTKQAQFMGLLSKQKNPTFAKQKTQPQQIFNSPVTPMMQNNNLPNFGTLSPVQELGPQQKSRRKQILKQLNEQIQNKKKHKAQKQRLKSQNTNNAFQSQNKNFIKKKQQIEQEEIDKKELRKNLHMKKQDVQKLNNPVVKEQYRKAFESRPKIRRTPPKQQEIENN